MADYRILIKPSAVREIQALPQKERQRIIVKIRSLSNDPRPLGCEKLSGQDKYRIRQGVYRIVYSIVDGGPTVIISKGWTSARSLSVAHPTLH